MTHLPPDPHTPVDLEALETRAREDVERAWELLIQARSHLTDILDKKRVLAEARA
jgi:hypothetical protein